MDEFYITEEEFEEMERAEREKHDEKVREEGRKEGKKVGRKEGKEEVAKNLRGVIADEEISRVSGLSLERVKQL